MARSPGSPAAGVAAFLLGVALVAGGALAAILLLQGGDGPAAAPSATTTTSAAGTTTGGATSSSLAPPTTPPPSSTTTATTIPLRLACRDGECLSGGAVDYLIVTRPMFVEALAPFIDWKARTGFSVGLATVEWLDANFAGDDLAERMKAGMHDIRRLAAGGGTLFVLLVGDTEVARDDFSVEAMRASLDLTEPWNTPTGFYRRIDNDPPGEVLPSDAYFVEDADWDPAGTGLNPIGGPNGQGSMVATLYLGRWPVRTTGEVEIIAAKTMTVAPAESLLYTGDVEFLSDAGCCDRWPPNDAMFGTGTRLCCYLRPSVVADRLLGADAPWLATEYLPVDLEVPGDDAFRRLLGNQGAAFIAFHGMYECTSMTHGVCVDAATMSFEHPFSLLNASACYIAAFYSGATDTLSEGILKKPVGPAVVTQADHNEYGYVELLLQGLPVGQAFWGAAADYVYWLNPMLLLGDPSLVVVRGPGG